MNIEAQFVNDSRFFWTPKERSVASKLEAVDKLMNFNDPHESLDKLSGLIDQGAYVIIASDHNHHVNIQGLYGVVNRLRSKPMYGWDLIVADSLVEGDQGESLRDFTLGMVPYLAQQDIVLRPVLREKDIYTYYGEGKKSEEELSKAKSRSAETARLLTDAAYTGQRGLLIFPSGTIEEARRRPDGRRNAMGRVKSPLMGGLLRRAAGKGVNIAVLPLGMSETYKIIEPDTRIPSPRALAAMGMLKAAEFMGKDFHPSTLADVNIGKVLDIDDFEAAGIDFVSKGNDQKIVDVIMQAIANLVPFSDRGDYDGRRFRS